MRTGVLSKGDRVLVRRLELASSLVERMRGLLGRSCLGEGCGMLIAPCGAIHTFGMRFALDVFFIGRDGEVVRAVRGVGPGRMVAGGPGAHAVLEVEAGWLPGDGLCPGDRVSIVPDA